MHASTTCMIFFAKPFLSNSKNEMDVMHTFRLQQDQP
jgi:hypothetical protein